MANYWTPMYGLMLEEARRSIDRQSERVQHVRERAVGLVGFGSIVAAALGLAGSQQLGVTGAVAACAFVVVAGSALYILVPREFQFELGATRIEEWFNDPDIQRLGIPHALYSAAKSHDENHAYNHRKLARLQNAVAAGVAALTVQTLALVARLVF